MLVARIIRPAKSALAETLTGWTTKENVDGPTRPIDDVGWSGAFQVCQPIWRSRKVLQIDFLRTRVRVHEKGHGRIAPRAKGFKRSTRTCIESDESDLSLQSCGPCARSYAPRGSCARVARSRETSADATACLRDKAALCWSLGRCLTRSSPLRRIWVNSSEAQVESIGQNRRGSRQGGGSGPLPETGTA